MDPTQKHELTEEELIDLGELIASADLEDEVKEGLAAYIERATDAQLVDLYVQAKLLQANEDELIALAAQVSKEQGEAAQEIDRAQHGAMDALVDKYAADDAA